MSNIDCLIPTYVMNDFQKKTCGHTLGKISAIIVFVILLIIFLFSYLPKILEKGKKDDEEKKKEDKVTALLIFTFIFIISMVVYFIRKFFFKIEISQDNSMIQNFMKKGMTETEAIKELAKVRQFQSLRNRSTNYYYN